MEKDINLDILKKVSVLYVEDNADIRNLFAHHLNHRVGALYLAANGKEALQLFDEKESDIVITDILMPEMDGLELAERIKQRDANVPIIVTTSYNEQDYLIRAIDIGVDKYVIKPIRKQNLLEAAYRAAQSILQNREIQSQNRFIRYLLDSQPNYMVIVKDGAIEIINRTFLELLGFSDLEAFKASKQPLHNYFVSLNDQSCQGGKCYDWMDRIRSEPDRDHIVHISIPGSGEVKACIVTYTAIPEGNRRIFSFTDITQFEREKSKLQKKAIYDSLTGAYNRGQFDSALRIEIVYSKQAEKPLSLIMFDLDNFKIINDTLGHQAGDDVLQSLARLVRESIRENDIFARWGGDEFMILLPGTSREKALSLAEKLRQIIAASVTISGMRVTCSFGVAEAGTADTELTLLQRTDKALYQAKSLGRNRTEFA